MPRDIIQLGRNFLLSLGGEGLQSGFHFRPHLSHFSERHLPAFRRFAQGTRKQSVGYGRALMNPRPNIPDGGYAVAIRIAKLAELVETYRIAAKQDSKVLHPNFKT